MLSRNSSQFQNKLIRPLKISLINNDNKIKDYNIEISSQHSSNFLQPSSNPAHQIIAGGGHSAAGDMLSMLDSEGEDYMTKEEEVAKINQELQY